MISLMWIAIAATVLAMASMWIISLYMSSSSKENNTPKKLVCLDYRETKEYSDGYETKEKLIPVDSVRAFECIKHLIKQMCF